MNTYRIEFTYFTKYGKSFDIEVVTSECAKLAKDEFFRINSELKGVKIEQIWVQDDETGWLPIL